MHPDPEPLSAATIAAFAPGGGGVGEPSGLGWEHALLIALAARGLPVPRPRWFQEPDTLVLDFVEGTSDLPPEPAEAMAALLAAVHQTPLDGLPALPDREDPRPDLESWYPWMWDVYVATAAYGAMGLWGLPPEVLARRQAATLAFLADRRPA